MFIHIDKAERLLYCPVVNDTQSMQPHGVSPSDPHHRKSLLFSSLQYGRQVVNAVVVVDAAIFFHFVVTPKPFSTINSGL